MSTAQMPPIVTSTFPEPNATALFTATTLGERVARLRSLPGTAAPAVDVLSEVQSVTWPARTLLLERNAWDQRLSALGVSDEQFDRAISDPSYMDPDVAASLASFVEEVVALAPGAATDVDCPEHWFDPGVPQVPLGIARYVVRLMDSMLSEIRAYAETAIDYDAVREQLLSRYLQDLQRYISPAIVTAMWSEKAEGRLHGKSPEDRYAWFCTHQLRSPDWHRTLLTRWPVLARRLRLTIERRVERSRELLEAFLADRADLWALCQHEEVAGTELSKLVGVDGPLGDLHRGGRSVYILELASGDRLVFKPRSLHIDTAFAGLLRYLNEGGLTPDLVAPSVLDRGEYGWMKFVHAADVPDEAAVGRFFARQGANLALLYLLGSYDFMFENVIASGEYPYLVDLECLYTPPLVSGSDFLPETEARRLARDSVLRVGLLPHWAWGDQESVGINISALQPVGGQLLPQMSFAWSGKGTDELRLEYAEVRLEATSQHLPHLRGVPVAVNAFVAQFIDGFRRCYDLLMAHRDELLAPGGPLADFGGAMGRVILRPTYDYSRLVGELRHPDFLADAVAADRLLDRLFASLSLRFTPRVVQSEIEQLLNIDIPMFYARADAPSIYDAAGTVIEESYFPVTAVDALQGRLVRLSIDDRERQCRFIYNAFMAIHHGEETRPILPAELPSDVSEDPSAIEPRDLARAAFGLADRLLSDAIIDQKSVSWIDLEMTVDGRWQQSSLELGLYDGGEGIALFLLAAHRCGGDAQYLNAVEKITTWNVLEAFAALRGAKSRMAALARFFPNIAMFPACSLYFLAHVERDIPGVLSDDIVELTLDWITHGIQGRPRCDFLTGAAGLASLLLEFRDHRYGDRAVALAQRCGELLVQHAIPTRGGVAWRRSGIGDLLAGFSHGSGGVAIALARLANVTGSEEYSDLAHRALAFERALFRPDWQDWQDEREPDVRPSHSHWCHGAAGIGLSRALLAREGLDDPFLEKEAEIAVARTLLSDAHDSDCLCHGSLGNTMVVRRIANAFDRPDWNSQADKMLLSAWHAAAARRHWRCGPPEHQLIVPGLFMGIAGVGYGLLHSVAPDRVPAVLEFALPRSAPSRAAADGGGR